MDAILPRPYRLTVLSFTLLVWLAAYFLINRFQGESEHHIDLQTPLDRKIPFMPLFAPLYFSTYAFVLQPFMLLSGARQFYWMLASFTGITLISSLIHAAWPSKIERIDQAHRYGITGWMLGLFQGICKPYGNFPSMHVGLCVPVVAANFMAGGTIPGCIALIWAVLIAVSTLFTKQHYILDVLAGLSIGVAVLALTFGFMMS